MQLNIYMLTLDAFKESVDTHLKSENTVLQRHVWSRIALPIAAIAYVTCEILGYIGEIFSCGAAAFISLDSKKFIYYSFISLDCLCTIPKLLFVYSILGLGSVYSPSNSRDLFQINKEQMESKIPTADFSPIQSRIMCVVIGVLFTPIMLIIGSASAVAQLSLFNYRGSMDRALKAISNVVEIPFSTLKGLAVDESRENIINYAFIYKVN